MEAQKKIMQNSESARVSMVSPLRCFHLLDGPIAGYETMRKAMIQSCNIASDLFMRQSLHYSVGVPYFQVRLTSRNCMKKVGMQCCCAKHSITVRTVDGCGAISVSNLVRHRLACFWNLFQPQPACCCLEYLQHRSQRRSLGKVDFSPYIKPLQKTGTTSP